MQPPETAVIRSSRLEASDLQRLFSHEASVLHVTNFFPKLSAMKLGQELAQEAILQHQTQSELKNWKVSTSKGLESSDVFTLGAHLPYNIAVANNALDKYFENVPKELRQRRRNEGGNNREDGDTAKLLWPLDQLRLELDEIWPHGAGLAPHRGGGLPRIMMSPTRWKRGFVHVDEMGPLSVSGLFSANIYLQVPQVSTERNSSIVTPPVLEIWPLNIQNRWDWYRVRTMDTLCCAPATLLDAY